MRGIWKLIKMVFKLIAIYVIVVVVIGSFLFFFPDVWSPPLLREVEKFSQGRFGITLKADRLRWVGVWPTVWRIENPSFILPGKRAQGTAQAIELRFNGSRIDNNWARPKIEIGVSFLVPKLELLLEGNQSKAATSQVDLSPSLGLPLVRPQGFDISIWIEVINGQIGVRLGENEAPYRLEKVSMKALLPSTRAEIWKPTLIFKSQMAMTVRSIAIAQPLTLDLSEVELGVEKVKILKGAIVAAELPFSVEGYYYFTSSAMKWDLNLPVTDVAKVPVSFLPPGEWAGSFSGALAAERGEHPPLSVTGRLETQGLSGNVSWVSESASVEGPASARGSLRFAYGEKLRLDDFSMSLDLKGALVEAKPYLKKAVGTDMLLDVVADGDGESISLRRASLLLGPLKIVGTGRMDLRENGLVQASLSWPTTGLAGLERIFLPLSQAPLRGQVEGELDIQGPWQKPELIAADLKSMRLQNMFGSLRWVSQSGLKLSGPIAGNADVSVFVKGGRVDRAKAFAAFDLSSIEISGHDVLRKPAVLPLKAIFDIDYQKSKVALKYLKLVGPGGDITMSSTVQLERDKLPLTARLVLAKARVESWLKFLVKPPVQLAGELSGAMDVKGTYIFEEAIAASPIRAFGKFDLSKGVLIYKSPKAVMAAEHKIDIPEPPPEPLLPSWPVIRNSDIDLHVDLQRGLYDNLEFGKVESELRLQSGQITGRVAIGSIWGGRVQTQKIIISPLSSPPGVETVIAAHEIHAGPMLGWFSPALKGYMKGLLSGQVAVIGPIPRGASGLKNIKADGGVQVTNGQFLTWEMESKINEKLKKVGLGKNKGLNAKDILFRANSKFVLNDGSAKVSQLDLLTTDRDEIRIRGTVNLDMTMDLAGTAFVASQRVGGSIAQANSDASGRLAIPLQVRGSVTDPEFLFAEATLKKMLEITAEREAKRALSKAQDQLKDDLKKDVKKKLKDMFGK